MSEDVVRIGRAGKPRTARFRFQLEGTDTVWELPMMQNLPKDLLMRLRTVALKLADRKTGKVKANPRPEDVVEAIEVQQQLMERYCPGLYEQMSDEEIAHLMGAWQEASDIRLGESSASSN